MKNLTRELSAEERLLKAFIYIMISRITNPTWQAAHLPTDEMLKYNGCFNLKKLRYCLKDLTSAYWLLYMDFGKLPERWQKALSGKTQKEWREELLTK